MIKYWISLDSVPQAVAYPEGGRGCYVLASRFWQEFEGPALLARIEKIK